MYSLTYWQGTKAWMKGGGLTQRGALFSTCHRPSRVRGRWAGGSPCVQLFGDARWPGSGEEGLDEKSGKSRGCWGQAGKLGWLPGLGLA